MRIRHIVLPLLSVTAVYLTLSAFNGDDTPAAPVAQTAVVIPQDIPAAALAPAPVQTAGNLKAAFDAHPAPPNYNYALPAAKTAAAPAEANPSVFSQKFASIQSGINTLLEASSDMLVSTRKVVVGKGDTLMDILVRNNVPRNEAHEAIAALSKVYDPRDLNPKHEITVFFNRDPSIADPGFKGLSIEKDMISTVTVNRDDNGGYKADQAEKDIHRGTKAVRGTIDSSLYVSAKSQGVPDGIILDLIKMYSLNVDFQRDIHAGDTFEIMFEEYTTDNGDVVPGKGNIMFARMDLGDRSLPFYRFEDSAGDVGFYDEKGRSAKRSLMKTPIDGARVSSGYGMRRHPVLGYSKMHKGMDFAAPRGTPIYAAGDGTIVKLGPFSSYGKYIKIRHQGGLETAYAHMNGYKPGLKNGSRVKQGQVIGYVGTTGRSTGPHLHYEVLQNGKQINPNSLKLPSGTTLAGKDLKKFKSMVEEIHRDFDKGGAPATAAKEENAKVRTAAKQ